MSCVVKGCKNGYRSTRQENIRRGLKQKSLFKSPKSPERRKKWCKVLGLQEDQLKPKHAICEDHFDPNDVIRFDVTHLPDGTKFFLEREKCRLHPQAVPCNGIPNETLNDMPKGDSKVVIQSLEGTRTIKTEFSATESAKIDVKYSFEELKNDMKHSDRSNGWGSVLNLDTIDFLNWDPFNFRIKMVVRVQKDLRMKLFTADKHLIRSLDLVPKSFAEIIQELTSLKKITLYEGTASKNRHPEECLEEADSCQIEKKREEWKLCKPCCDFRKQELERQRELKKNGQRRLKLTNRKNSRLKIKIDKLKGEVERSKKKCAGIQEKVLHDKIETLPLPIQESVRTCLAAAKVKPKGRRYTMNWINECMLIRMKSRSIYEHLRTHSILPLPCIDTLDRYIKKLSLPGTNSGVSDSEKEELATIMSTEKGGSLLLDDMTVTERIDLDKFEISKKLEEMKGDTADLDESENV